MLSYSRARYPDRPEHLCSEALLRIPQERQQEVLCAHGRVPERAGLLLGEPDDPPRGVAVAVEHLDYVLAWSGGSVG